MIEMGVLDSVSLSSSWKKRESNTTEPISVLDTHRSPSPSTSTSTLSGNTHFPATDFLAAAAMEVAGDEDWEALFADSGRDEWIVKEAIQSDTYISAVAESVEHSLSNASSENPLPQISYVGTQSVNFSSCSNETMDEKVHFLNSFSSNSSNPVSFIQQPLLKNPNLGNLENFSLHPQILKLDTQTPSSLQLQTLVSNLDQQPPLKRPNLDNSRNLERFSPNPQVSKYDTQPTSPLHLQNLVRPQPPLKRPNLGNNGNLDKLSSHHHVSNNDTFPKNHQLPLSRTDPVNSGNCFPNTMILELDKHPPETQQLVPHQVVYDQFYKASELLLAGNLTNAHSILARLNHQLSPGTKPFQRASFYLKEALIQLPLLGPASAFSKSSTPVDGLFMMGAFKLFSEVSPISHFINFTSNQAILEAVGESERVHVIDFDIGSGAQWASFIAELPNSKGSPCLKVTALASPLTHHPFELGLMHENLTQFANKIGVRFELEVVNLDLFDLSANPVYHFNKETALAVNFPIWAFSNRLSIIPSLIRFIKQLSPKIVVSMERGCERTDLSFSHHLLHSLQYYEALLDSIDSSSANLETVSKIEKFVVKPMFENIVLGRLSYPDQMPHWRSLFKAAGFSQVNISNFNEAQAECVVAKNQVRGFRIERKQASLVISWQCQELVSASAWR